MLIYYAVLHSETAMKKLVRFRITTPSAEAHCLSCSRPLIVGDDGFRDPKTDEVFCSYGCQQDYAAAARRAARHAVVAEG